MPQYVDAFVVKDIPGIHAAFVKTIYAAESLVEIERKSGRNIGGRQMLADLEDAYAKFKQKLDAIALQGAASATTDMKAAVTRERPPTGKSPSLQSLVGAEPLGRLEGFETGMVGVGNVADLNRAVAPGWSTSYWRAQEYGTGGAGGPGAPEGVKSQVNRVLIGSFMEPGGGDPTPPMESQFRVHPIFKAGSGGYNLFASIGVPGGRTWGGGTIRREIPPKHFISGGAKKAANDWRSKMLKLKLECDQAIQRTRGEVRARIA